MVQSYRNLTTNELVPKEEALEYVLSELGLYIEPKGQVFTLEQREFLDMIVEWYFSGNWVLTNDNEEE